MKDYLSICRKTERLEVRPVTNDDYRNFVEGFKGQKPQQNRFDEGPFDWTIFTKEWLKEKVEERKDLALKDEVYKFGVFRRSDSAYVGFCCITTHMREDFQYASIGYLILNQYWGLGYGTESVKALIDIGFEDLNFHRLEAHINLDNPASKKLAGKAGMEFECIRKGFILEDDDEWTDNEIYYINNNKSGV